MVSPENQIADVNHYDNKIVVKYEDGTVTLLDGEKVRRHVDARDAATSSTELPQVTTELLYRAGGPKEV